VQKKLEKIQWNTYGGAVTLQLCVRGTVYVLSASAWGKGWTIVPYKLLLRCACGTPWRTSWQQAAMPLHPMHAPHSNKIRPSSVHEKKSTNIMGDVGSQITGLQVSCHRKKGWVVGALGGVVKNRKSTRYKNLVKRFYQHPLIKQNQNAARKLRSMIHTALACASP